MRVIVILATMFAATTFARETARKVDVVAVGEMRNVMRKGDLSATIDLRRLSTVENLYALGPVEGLKGEVTVWDGRPSIVRILDGRRG